MELKFYTIDVFTDKNFEGNQLAVIPNAEGIEDDIMQKIAKEFNYSETVFITSNDKKNTKNVRIFTPNSEIDFAGHPNIGAAMVLAQIGEFSAQNELDVIFKEKVGDVAIKIFFDEHIPNKAELQVAQLPKEGTTPPIINIAKSISLDVTDIDDSQSVSSFSCGLPFLFIPIISIKSLKQASLNLEEWKKNISETWAPQLYLFTKETELENTNFHTRMFAPGLGISEDPATGSAVAALAGHISKNIEKEDGEFTYMVEQGFEIGRPSIIEMSFSKKRQKIEHVKIRGTGKIFSEGEIKI